MIPNNSPKSAPLIVGKGEARQPHPELFEPRLRTVVRYADPAAWITAAAVSRAVVAIKEELAAVHDDMGVIVVSDEGPQETIQTLDEAAATGFSSPLRFPAGNPGSLAGVACILHGFRGPTMNFIMPTPSGVPVGLALAAGWLQRGVCASVVVAACARPDEKGLYSRSMVLSAGNRAGVTVLPLGDAEVAWLSFVGS
jgi:hypothetical protein